MLLAALVAVGVLLILFSIYSISDNLIQIEAQKEGIDTKKNNLSLMPSLGDLFGKPAPANAEPGKFHHLKKGHDIRLAGSASGPIRNANVSRYALRPTDYRGIAPIPKMDAQVGDEVKAGQAIFYDKQTPDIKYVAPVSGEIVELRRGAKRAVSHIVILADKEIQYKTHTPPSLNAGRNDIVSFLMSAGAWTLINQRPFDIVADPNVVPSNIFISTFDTAPLAPDMNLAMKGKEGAFQKGLDVLNQLTEGQVVLGIDGRGGEVSAAFSNATGVEKHWFSGKHPAGNVGVQIHHTHPIKSNTAVWTLKPEDVATIGRLFIDGKYDASRVVAITGAQVNEPHYAQTYLGASIDELLKGNIKAENKTRIVSGNVLTGKTTGEDDFLSSKTNMLTTIKEGDYHEMFGWLLPISPRPSLSRTYPNFLLGKHEFEADTNTHGEKRAFVVTGQYEKVMPMDVLPQHLMKAIMAGDIERMEGLGINELSEEDVALCEFACTSKMPLQSILREGLDLMREQG